MAEQDRIRVLRLIEYEGPRDLVEEQVNKSVHGTRLGLHGKIRITVITLGTYPEIIEEARAVSAPAVVENLQAEIMRLQKELQSTRAILSDIREEDISEEGHDH